MCYSEAVVSVQAEVVAMFLLNAVQEVGANELTGLCTVKAAYGYIAKVRCCFLSPWLTHVVEERLLCMENDVPLPVSDVNIVGSEF